MAPLTVRHISSTPEYSVDSDPSSTTLLDLRYQLFSLTDIPPDQLGLTVGSKRLLPNDDTDAVQTLADFDVHPGAVLFYEDLTKDKNHQSQAQQKQALDVSDLQSALAAVASRCAAAAPAAPSAAQRSTPVRADTAAFVARVRQYQEAVCQYEDTGLQEKARRVTPLEELKVKAAGRLDKEAGHYPTYELALAKELLIWFKNNFFKWMNAPECWSCGTETAMVGMAPPTEQELKHGASRVEQHDCKKCGATTRFPRYNDAGKLLETRKGRCGEWAQAFTLIAKAAGLRARAVHDWTDHVWTEIYTPDGEGGGRWVHADSCENVLDEPLLYEKGWKKKLNYCIATGADCIMDVTRRYTANFEALKPRRTLADEWELKSALEEINARIVAALPLEQQDSAIRRYESDAKRIGMPGKNTVYLPGRQSGNDAWIKSRGEDGSSNN